MSSDYRPSPDQLRRAADAFRDNELHSLYDDFSDDIETLFDESVTEYLDVTYDADSYEDYGEGVLDVITDEMLSSVADNMEDFNNRYSVTYEWADGRLIYTDDIWDYYQMNKNDCDSNLHEIDLASCDDIDSIVAAVVHVTFVRQADSELENALDTIRDGGGDFRNYLD